MTPLAAWMYSFTEVILSEISNVCFLNVILIIGQDEQTEMVQSDIFSRRGAGDILLPELCSFLGCSPESRPSVMCNVIYTNIMKACKGC